MQDIIEFSSLPNKTAGSSDEMIVKTPSGFGRVNPKDYSDGRLNTLEGTTETHTSQIAGKLEKTELRSGLGVKKVLVTDASGNEVEVSGTTGQVLGFGASNVPQAMSPSVDIHALTQKTTPIGADEALISDSEASWINKKVLLKDMVMISEQTAQSSFSSDNDLFLVKQASGGLRKMTVADVRNALLRTGYNAPAAIAVYLLSGSNNTDYYSSSVASGTNKGGIISATFVADNQNSYSSTFVYAFIQTSPNNSTWTTVWSDNWTTYSSGGDPPLTSVRSITQVYDALYVRIGIQSSNVTSGGRIKGYATVNLIK